MDGEPVSKTSKGLVKRIVRMVRVTSILKARVLKKSWRARFSSTYPQVNEVKKQGEEVKTSLEDSQDDKVNSEGEEVSNMSLQTASQVHKGKKEGAEFIITLPEDLVERILAMVPYPYLFKGRALSKSWRARFSPISSQDDEVKQQLAVSFQKKVVEWSVNWKTFCPIFTFCPRFMDSAKAFLAFDRASHSWQRMPSLAFLPKSVLKEHLHHYRRTSISMSEQQIDGALLLLSGFHPHHTEDTTQFSNFFIRSWKELRPPVHESARELEHKLYVANLLTRRWKELPCPPLLDRRNSHFLFTTLVSQTLLGTYKVIVFYCMFFSMEELGGPGSYITQIYDSKSDTWSSKTLMKERLIFEPYLSAYFNGVVYMPLGDNPTNLLAFNVEEGTFEELEIVGDVTELDVEGLVVCNDNLLMIVSNSSFSKPVQVLKIDLESLTVSEVARGPPALLGVDMVNIPSGCDSHCICFPTIGHNGTVVYNVREDRWSHIHFPVTFNYNVFQTNLTFQPNLNPFLEV